MKKTGGPEGVGNPIKSWHLGWGAFSLISNCRFIFIFKIYNKIEKRRNTKGSDKIRREAYGGGGR